MEFGETTEPLPNRYAICPKGAITSRPTPLVRMPMRRWRVCRSLPAWRHVPPPAGFRISYPRRRCSTTTSTVITPPSSPRRRGSCPGGGVLRRHLPHRFRGAASPGDRRFVAERISVGVNLLPGRCFSGLEVRGGHPWPPDSGCQRRRCCEGHNLQPLAGAPGGSGGAQTTQKPI